ncbi:SRPBCC family protein [Streptomyces axinellae]|uniref:SRPBCC family protein n=1 Tax=Streptomyces axinellae TaxID=552788 RepID=A0ABP6C9R1_9ACTN
MADKADKASGEAQGAEATDGSSGLDRLKEEIGNHLQARAHHALSAVGERVTGLTDKLDGSDGSELLTIGQRVLGGESSLKAIAGEKTKNVKDKVTGGLKGALGGGGGGGGGGGNNKVTNIVETLDIGLPRRTVYNFWTELEEFSGFTKGVQSVKMSDEVESEWKAKVAFSDRSWTATIEEQLPDERIRWTSKGARGSTKGIVTFHELTPTLTRLVVVVEYFPSGFFEKTGNLWRAQGRRLRLDLKHFQRYVTLEAEEEPEGWRGEIEDSEVVLSHEDALAQEKEEEDGEEEYENEEEGDEGEEGDEEEQAA